MTDQEINIKIAEACGWVVIRVSDHEYNMPYLGIAKSLEDSPNRLPLPDYCNDLNAMHEAEKVMTYKQNYQYRQTLHSLTKGLPIFATARQRAEAFIKTIES